LRLGESDIHSEYGGAIGYGAERALDKRDEVAAAWAAKGRFVSLRHLPAGARFILAARNQHADQPLRVQVRESALHPGGQSGNRAQDISLRSWRYCCQEPPRSRRKATTAPPATRSTHA